MKRRRGMKVRVDKSRGIVTLIAKIKPTEPSRLAKTSRAKKTKMIRFLGQFSGQSTSLTVSMQEKQAQKVIV